MSKITKAIKGMSVLKKVMVGMWLGVASTLIALVALLIAFGSNLSTPTKIVANENPFSITQTVDADKTSDKLDPNIINVIQTPTEDVLSDVIKSLGKDKVVDNEAAAVAKFKATPAQPGPFYSIDRAGSSITRYVSGTDKDGKVIAVKSTFTLAPNKKAKTFTDDSKTKANAAAAVGTVFALTLVGAIGVTVAESIYRKRGAK